MALGISRCESGRSPQHLHIYGIAPLAQEYQATGPEVTITAQADADAR